MAKVYAPNKQYDGVSATVEFVGGVGETNDAHLLNMFREWGYKVEEEPAQEVHEPKTLEEMTDAELRAEAKNMGLEGYSKLNKGELLAFLLEEVAKRSAENNQE